MIQPPITGPKIGATITVIAHRPSARPRFSGGYERIRMVCESGTIGPDTSPCSNRNAISDSKFCAKPQRADAIVKSSTDSVNRRTSPTRRASQPVNGTAIAEATEYDEITHVPWLVATPRLPEMVGTATFAIDVSSTSMNVPSASPTVSNASVPPANGAGSAAGAATAGAVAAMIESPQSAET